MSDIARNLLILASIFAFGQNGAAQTQTSGCEEGQVIGTGLNARLTLCSQAARELPKVQDQLARLAALSAKNTEQESEIARFVKDLNATGKLLDTRVGALSASVSKLLQDSNSRTDAQLVRDVGTLARQLEDLRERIEAQSNRPDTASRTREAMAGILGDDIARLDLVSALNALEAIPRIEKKIDSLGERIDCSSATAEAMQLALKANLLDRVRSILACRPEIASDEKVGLLVSHMFDESAFAASRDFLEGLWTSGLIVSSGVCLSSHQALYTGNSEGFRWLLLKVPSGTLERCPGFANDFLGDNFFQSHDDLVARIAALKQEGLSLNYGEDLLFRMAYDGWLDYGYRGWKELSDALAPSTVDSFRVAKSRVESAVVDSPSIDESVKIRYRDVGATYCPPLAPYCRELSTTAINQDAKNTTRSVTPFFGEGTPPVPELIYQICSRVMFMPVRNKWTDFACTDWRKQP